MPLAEKVEELSIHLLDHQSGDVEDKFRDHVQLCKVIGATACCLPQIKFFSIQVLLILLEDILRVAGAFELLESLGICYDFCCVSAALRSRLDGQRGILAMKSIPSSLMSCIVGTQTFYPRT